jgi:hypothetical protein
VAEPHELDGELVEVGEVRCFHRTRILTTAN